MFDNWMCKNIDLENWRYRLQIQLAVKLWNLNMRLWIKNAIAGQIVNCDLRSEGVNYRRAQHHSWEQQGPVSNYHSLSAFQAGGYFHARALRIHLNYKLNWTFVVQWWLLNQYSTFLSVCFINTQIQSAWKTQQLCDKCKDRGDCYLKRHLVLHIHCTFYKQSAENKNNSCS